MREHLHVYVDIVLYGLVVSLPEPPHYILSMVCFSVLFRLPFGL